MCGIEFVFSNHIILTTDCHVSPPLRPLIYPVRVCDLVCDFVCDLSPIFTTRVDGNRVELSGNRALVCDQVAGQDYNNGRTLLCPSTMFWHRVLYSVRHEAATEKGSEGQSTTASLSVNRPQYWNCRLLQLNVHYYDVFIASTHSTTYTLASASLALRLSTSQLGCTFLWWPWPLKHRDPLSK